MLGSFSFHSTLQVRLQQEVLIPQKWCEAF